MNKRIKRKMNRMDKAQSRLYDLMREIESLIGRTNDRLLDVRETDIRLTDIVKESMEAAGKVPLKIADWVATPPKRNGDYVVWFVRNSSVQIRYYALTSKGWVNGLGKPVEPGKYKPSCYLLLPTLSPLMISMYRGGSNDEEDPF